jgi:hypothetical protein
MPASTTALTVAPHTDARGFTWDEQPSDVSPGNNFVNDGKTLLFARNTTAGVLALIFEADRYGAERTVMQVNVPANGTENGVAVFGPFPTALFNDHGTTEPASSGRVFVRQASGTDGQVVLCPFRIEPSLLAGG